LRSVIPAQAGIQGLNLHSRLRGNDGRPPFLNSASPLSFGFVRRSEYSDAETRHTPGILKNTQANTKEARLLEKAGPPKTSGERFQLR
jgi:hypothetical protein